MEEDKIPEVLNRLAREQLKKKILNDIMVDLTVCDVEGWDKREYIRELHELIDSLAPNGRTAEA